MAIRQVHLPDGFHIFEVHESERFISFSVYNRFNCMVKQRASYIKAALPNWEDIVGLAEDMAKKKYKEELRNKRKHEHPVGGRGWS